MSTVKNYVSFDKLSKYHDLEVARTAAESAQALADAKAYANSLAPNYDVAGAANTALEAAKTYADGKDAAIQAAQKAGDDAAAAAAVADGKAVAAQKTADDLAAYVGEFTSETANTVVAYIDEKTANIASDDTVEAIDERLTQAEKDIDAIEADYLKAADKTELNNAIVAEKERAEAAEKVNADAIKAITDDYLVAADKTELEGKITAAQEAADEAQNTIDAFLEAAEVGEAAVDTLKEIQQYITTDGEAAATMTANIQANADAIDAVEGRMDTAEGKITTLEGKMTAVEGAVATKVEQEAYNTKISALEGEDTAIKGRLDDIEEVLGEGGNVEDQIATAKAEAIAAAAEDATTKANQAKADAIAHANGLDTAMNTRVEALEAVDHEHANKALLDTYTQTEENLADAVAKKHAHANAAVLEGITADKVTTWDTVTTKATITALEEEAARAVAKENELAVAIGAFTECTDADINGLFQQ